METVEDAMSRSLTAWIVTDGGWKGKIVVEAEDPGIGGMLSGSGTERVYVRLTREQARQFADILVRLSNEA